MPNVTKDGPYTALLAEANNHLAFCLYKKLAKKEGNVFFSPFSISLAMSMLFRGTHGKTAAEMRKVLGFDAVKLPTDEVHKSVEKLLKTLVEIQTTYTLAVANAVVCHIGFPMLPAYKVDVQKSCRALTSELDFEKDCTSAVEKINGWIKKNTHDKICKMISDVDQSTVLVLLNAVYFKGFWSRPFRPEFTRPMPFYNKGMKDQVKDVPMMYSRAYECYNPYMENDKFQALQLPYKGNDVVMILLLPRERDGLYDLKDELQPDFINDIRSKMNSEYVILYLPKLNLEFQKNLSCIFQELGLNSVFDSNSDFSNICDVPGLYVSEISHQAVLEVNEEGTEAAGRTVIAGGGAPPEFLVDHPFLLMIYDVRYDLCLFLGHVDEM